MATCDNCGVSDKPHIGSMHCSVIDQHGMLLGRLCAGCAAAALPMAVTLAYPVPAPR